MLLLGEIVIPTLHTLGKRDADVASSFGGLFQRGVVQLILGKFRCDMQQPRYALNSTANKVG